MSKRTLILARCVPLSLRILYKLNNENYLRSFGGVIEDDMNQYKLQGIDRCRREISYVPILAPLSSN